MNAPTASQQPKTDPIGDALKNLAHSQALIVGLIAAAATLVVAWAIVLVLSLIPSEAVRGGLGLQLFSVDPLSTFGRLVRAFFAPWNSALKTTEKDSPGYAFTTSGVWFFSCLIASLTVAAAGLVVRRVLTTARARLSALLVAALASGGLLALCAAVVHYTQTITEPSGGGGTSTFVEHFTFPSGTMFLSAFFVTLLVGVFSYGVVGLLGKQFDGALRRGALYVVVPTLIAGVLLPFVVASRTVPNVQGGGSAFWNGSRFAAGVASSSVPLAFGARATFDLTKMGAEQSPFFAGYSKKSGNDMYRWAKLEKYIARHASARITGYLGAYGGIGVLVGVLLALAVVGAWVMIVARYVASMGAPRSVDGLRLGLLIGIVGAVAIVAVTALGRQTWMQVSPDGTVRTVWGAGGSAVVQAALLLAALGGVVGFVYAAYRPSPLRYKPLDMSKWAGPTAASRTVARPVDAVVTPAAVTPAAVAPAAVEPAAPVAVPTTTAELTEVSPADAPTAVLLPTEPAAVPVPPEAAAISAPGEPAAAATATEPARFCPACGAAYADDEARFCGSCGRARPESV
jgi:hypothetical protein